MGHITVVRLKQPISLFVVLTLYKVAVNIELVSTEPLLLQKIHGEVPSH